MHAHCWEQKVMELMDTVCDSYCRWPLECRSSEEPVSYTHLDVYKRQTDEWWHLLAVVANFQKERGLLQSITETNGLEMKMNIPTERQ